MITLTVTVEPATLKTMGGGILMQVGPGRDISFHLGGDNGVETSIKGVDMQLNALFSRAGDIENAAAVRFVKTHLSVLCPNQKAGTCCATR